MSIKQLAEQHALSQRKLMSHFNMLNEYDELSKEADRRLNQYGSKDIVANMIIAQMEGMENMATAIINTTPDDWS